MAYIPTQVSALLQDLTTHLPIILGRNPVGLYLYGSLTQHAFDPKRSDVDCLAVTRRDLSEAQFRRLGAWLARAAKSNPWVARLQMLFLIENQVLAGYQSSQDEVGKILMTLFAAHSKGRRFRVISPVRLSLRAIERLPRRTGMRHRLK